MLLQTFLDFYFPSFLQAEKFGDSFVFEGMLSEQVKSDIQQAVSKVLTGSHVSLLLIRNGLGEKSKLQALPLPPDTSPFSCYRFSPGQASGPGHHVLKKITQTWDNV